MPMTTAAEATPPPPVDHSSRPGGVSRTTPALPAAAGQAPRRTGMIAISRRTGARGSRRADPKAGTRAKTGSTVRRQQRRADHRPPAAPAPARRRSLPLYARPGDRGRRHDRDRARRDLPGRAGPPRHSPTPSPPRRQGPSCRTPQQAPAHATGRRGRRERPRVRCAAWQETTAPPPAPPTVPAASQWQGSKGGEPKHQAPPPGTSAPRRAMADSQRSVSQRPPGPRACVLAARQRPQERRDAAHVLGVMA